jgi:hypothetical protein
MTMDENSAASRAQWLAHLALALDDARRLVRTLKREHRGNPSIFDLGQRIEAARLELQALRLQRRREPVEVDQEWMQLIRKRPAGDKD